VLIAAAEMSIWQCFIIITFHHLIVLQGEEHDYIEDWGEQMVGKTSPVVCILDVDSGDIKVLNDILEDCSQGQVR
jgi:hypothetical protein